MVHTSKFNIKFDFTANIAMMTGIVKSLDISYLGSFSFLPIFMDILNYRYIFSTEGHLLPMTPQISLAREHCSYLGAYCRSDDPRWKSRKSGISSDADRNNGTSRFYRAQSLRSFPPGSTSHDYSTISGVIKVRVHLLIC